MRVRRIQGFDVDNFRDYSGWEFRDANRVHMHFKLWHRSAEDAERSALALYEPVHYPVIETLQYEKRWSTIDIDSSPQTLERLLEGYLFVTSPDGNEAVTAQNYPEIYHPLVAKQLFHLINTEGKRLSLGMFHLAGLSFLDSQVPTARLTPSAEVWVEGHEPRRYTLPYERGQNA